MRKFRIYFKIGESPIVEVTCVKINMRDGFFECMNDNGVALAFYRCDLVKGIDSNPA